MVQENSVQTTVRTVAVVFASSATTDMHSKHGTMVGQSVDHAQDAAKPALPHREHNVQSATTDAI